jgi:alkylhydroperoxidase family enzyme
MGQTMRYDALVQRLKDAVFDSTGHTSRELRRAVADQRLNDLPETLRDYVAKVAKYAYKVTDEDVTALKAAGYSEDQIFEITASASVGAALARLERGMAAVKGSGGSGGSVA